jgi:hypothetical protein
MIGNYGVLERGVAYSLVHQVGHADPAFTLRTYVHHD